MPEKHVCFWAAESLGLSVGTKEGAGRQRKEEYTVRLKSVGCTDRMACWLQSGKRVGEQGCSREGQ